MNYKEPIETLTNIAYCIVAFLLCLFNYNPIETPILVAALMTLGVGSFWYHDKGGSLNLFDYWGMHIVFMAIALVNFSKIFDPVLVYSLGVSLASIYGLFLIRKGWHTFVEVGIIYTVALVSDIIVNGWREATIAAIVMGIAFYVRQATEKREYKDNDNKGHGVWHLITALGLYLMAT